MPLTGPYVVVDDFLPADLAAAMRGDIDRHFSEPGAHRPESHQVWNYWFVPELYAYLRTTPEKIIERPLVDRFFATLTAWSAENTGMLGVSWPYLSLYVPGCRQGMHNDSRNGRFGFVYSLTRDARRTTGGETILHREGDHFRAKLAQASAGSGFFECVEPRFNRLLVFDDRLPHAVERIDGVMDPVEGRFVLHGHLSEAGALVTGALAADVIGRIVVAHIRELMEAASARLALYHGPLVLRLAIKPDGGLARCEVVLDRVIHPDIGDAEWAPWLRSLLKRLETVKFPVATGPTRATLPLIFGGSLPGAERDVGANRSA